MYGNKSIHYVTHLLKIVNGVSRFGLIFRLYRAFGCGLYIPIRLNNGNVQFLFESAKFLTFRSGGEKDNKKTSQPLRSARHQSNLVSIMNNQLISQPYTQ